MAGAIERGISGYKLLEGGKSKNEGRDLKLGRKGGSLYRRGKRFLLKSTLRAYEKAIRNPTICIHLKLHVISGCVCKYTYSLEKVMPLGVTMLSSGAIH